MLRIPGKGPFRERDGQRDAVLYMTLPNRYRDRNRYVDIGTTALTVVGSYSTALPGNYRKHRPKEVFW